MQRERCCENVDCYCCWSMEWNSSYQDFPFYSKGAGGEEEQEEEEMGGRGEERGKRDQDFWDSVLKKTLV